MDAKVSYAGKYDCVTNIMTMHLNILHVLILYLFIFYLHMFPTLTDMQLVFQCITDYQFTRVPMQ